MIQDPQKQILRTNSAIFIGLAFSFFALLFFLICLYSKEDLHLILNAYHSRTLDTFFVLWTKIAEFAPYAVAFGLLFHRFADAIYVLAGELLGGLIVQITKHFVHAPRPFTYFIQCQPSAQLPIIEGNQMNGWSSFPSGHTASFFMLSLICVILISKSTYLQRNDKWKYTYMVVPIVFFLIALLGGYSRIYLSQHFAIDVCAGGGIGIVVALGLYFVYEKLLGTQWAQKRIQFKHTS